VRVYREPEDLDRAALADALRRHWGIDAARLDYLPVGFGTHHWAAVAAGGARWFVSGDDLQARQHAGRSPDDVFAGLERALRTAVVLREGAGLEFVVAPIPSEGGAVVRRLGERYAVRVEPFVEGRATADGEFERPEERRRMGALLGRLHTASGSLPAGGPARDDLALPGRSALQTALTELDAAWDDGPFADPARMLLQAHAGRVQDRLRTYDRQAARVRTVPGWVVTHGEPHSANVVREPRGGLRLVDWDTTLVAPRERDLWMTLDADRTGWDEYREVVGSVQVNEELLAFYRERWALAEICMYVAEFRRPHDRTQDTQASWDELREYLR